VFRAARVGRESIVILEGDDRLAKSIAKSLHKQGFTTRITATIKETARLVGRRAFDLVIASADLADGTVIDLFRTLEVAAKEGRPEVLITTSRDSRADQKMVMNAGACAVISKPFSMDGLLAAVERALADRRAAQEKAQLEKYVSKASMRMALEKSILSGKSAAARARRQQATILFSDVEDFTARCEHYQPSEVVTQINAMFEVMTRAIMDHGGDIDKFIGDACMAFWLHDEPQISAEPAIRAMLRIRRELLVMNRDDPVLRADPIRIRIGINSGEIILCDLGSADARIDLSVIGDHVNIAARLESACKLYGVDNLISGFSFDGLQDRFAARLIDRVRVKGKSEPVACYELIDEAGMASERQDHLLASFAQAMTAYRAGAFEQAVTLFEAADRFERRAEVGVLNPCRLFASRCRMLRDDPPDHWEGVWDMVDK
jgi:adenylate cyclase